MRYLLLILLVACMKPKEPNAQAKELYSNFYIIKESDSKRLIDCTGENYLYKPNDSFYVHDFMNFFKSDHNTLNGFMATNNALLYNHIHGMERLGKDNIILFGIRGAYAGPHRSELTKGLYEIYDKTDNTVIYMPSSFYTRNLKNLNTEEKLYSVCHRKSYDDTYIDSSWPALSNYNTWKVYNKLFQNKKMFLFVYSNGQIVREDLLSTSYYKIEFPSFVDTFSLKYFYSLYANNVKFWFPKELNNIQGIIDIETNYSREQELWNLIKFINEYILPNQNKIYYAACSEDSDVIYNHIRLINYFKLVGTQLKNGVIRYTDNNIFIDVVPGVVKNELLDKYTTYLKNYNKIDLVMNHYTIVQYATSEFLTIAKNRKIIY